MENNLSLDEWDLSQYYNESTEELTFGQRVADNVASFGGSWKFINCFIIMMVLWMAFNTAVLDRPLDAYPFILLNLCLSMLAALQGPIIMMSQNRTEARDRRRSEMDLLVDMRTEKIIIRIEERLEDVYSMLSTLNTKQNDTGKTDGEGNEGSILTQEKRDAV